MQVLIYGITKNKDFYFDWTFPEFYPNDSEMERDYRIISKERLLEAINIEIADCQNKFDNDKYEFLELLENTINLDEIVPASFKPTKIP